MSEKSTFVSYAFGYFRKAPRSAAEFGKASAVHAQLFNLKQFALATRWKGIELVLGYSTNRSQTFASVEMFRRAAQLAKHHNCPLVLADFSGLLSRTSGSLIDACVAELDALQIPIVDATSGALWAKLEPGARNALIRTAKVASALKSNAIKAGLNGSSKDRAPPAPGNRLNGPKINAVRADQRAERLRPFVEDFLKTLSPGALINPVALQRALNDDGIPSAQGKVWSPPAVKNLLRRLNLASDRPVRRAAPRSARRVLSEKDTT